MRTEDLKRVNPLWIKYSEDVRADPDAWNTSGDAYTKVQRLFSPGIAEARAACLCSPVRSYDG